ncbi:MAG: sulfide/dihydroorotate dehydrogenase-like FAD/NAD-binding protein, partial [Oscillospiraceae bacterium]|nr:sulfide/dihydroorotate dehydrogenase-like FAD/NAD-binding protein [Oscillospiraceae bacterium]
ISPKTEAVQEPTGQTGIAHRILKEFIEHFKKHPDSNARLFIASKSGPKHLQYEYEGESILDLVGPLGVATEIPEGAKRVCVIGGGVGCAIAYPQAKKCFADGLTVDVIAGFRNKDIVILEDEFRAHSHELIVCTDDGSYGQKGFVTNALQERIDAGIRYDCVIAIGPTPMMKFVCQVTKPYGIKTIVSLNPIMVDGTGMCGGCRVTVGGQVKYACVDGPDFDGHEVDFDELMRRSGIFREREADCRMMMQARQKEGE